MSVKEIENANSTRVCNTHIHTNKYIAHVPNEPTITSMRVKATDKYEKNSRKGETVNLLL